jgi:hypothetical protein
MNDAERYARNRLADMTKVLAGCLTPTTLEALVQDVQANVGHPVPEDVATFVSRMIEQRGTLVDPRDDQADENVWDVASGYAQSAAARWKAARQGRGF